MSATAQIAELDKTLSLLAVLDSSKEIYREP